MYHRLHNRLWQERERSRRAEGRGEGFDLGSDEGHHVWEAIIASEVKLIKLGP